MCENDLAIAIKNAVPLLHGDGIFGRELRDSSTIRIRIRLYKIRLDSLKKQTQDDILTNDLLEPVSNIHFNQNEKNKVSSTLLSLRLDAQPTVTY